MISILMMIAVVLALYFNQTASGFFVIGAVAGFAMAGTQSVSRTMVGMFSPPGLFFILGLVVLSFVDENKAREAASEPQSSSS